VLPLLVLFLAHCAVTWFRSGKRRRILGLVLLSLHGALTTALLQTLSADPVAYTWVFLYIVFLGLLLFPIRRLFRTTHTEQHL
jgi:hypothetical protein